MSNREPSRKAARAQRRQERKTAREHRRKQRATAGLAPSLTATPDDKLGGPTVLPAQQLRRRRTFELIERACSELIAVRSRRALALLELAPGTDAYTELGREIEALDDEIDDLRELSDDLLRRVAPLELVDDQLAQLEQTLSSAQSLAAASARAQALLGAARELLVALDEALDREG